MSSQVSRVSVVDDDPSVRRALARLLKAAELDVVTHASAQEYLDQYDPDIPGCLVLDLAMPGLNGLQLQNLLAAAGYVPPIIFLSGHATVPDSVQALKRGAIDFLTKPVDASALIDAVHHAFEKDRFDRAQRVERARVQQLLARLTPRERDVLALVVSGMLNKQIADELGTVEKTIKVHRGRVMQKMEVHSLAELVLLTAQADITTAFPPAVASRATDIASCPDKSYSRR
jgi:FixJ family two-component response regulator